MNEQTKLALINFSGLTATAIVRQANGKAVDWREIVDAHETLANALQSEMQDPYAPQSPNSALCDPAHGDAGKPKTL